MMYIRTRELMQLKTDVAAFIQGALAAPGPADVGRVGP